MLLLYHIFVLIIIIYVNIAKQPIPSSLTKVIHMELKTMIIEYVVLSI